MMPCRDRWDHLSISLLAEVAASCFDQQPEPPASRWCRSCEDWPRIRLTELPRVSVFFTAFCR